MREPVGAGERWWISADSLAWNTQIAHSVVMTRLVRIVLSCTIKSAVVARAMLDDDDTYKAKHICLL